MGHHLVPFGKQWTTIMSCVLGNPFEMDMFQTVSLPEGNQWIIVIKNAETNQQTLAFEPINRYTAYIKCINIINIVEI